jgi:uncharacterized membrane protein
VALTVAATTRSRRSDWLVPAMLILLSLVPAVAGTARLAQLAGGGEVTPANARFFAQPIPVVLHILAVVPYSMVGALQFSPGFRRRNRAWHRAAGRVLGVCGLVAALTGLWMAHFYPWPEGDGVGVYVERLIFGSAMVVSLLLGVHAVRRRDFGAHGAWMTRAYAIGMGAGTQVLTHLPWFILVGQPGESARTVLMGAGWVINVVVAEWIIRKGSRRGPRTSPHDFQLFEVLLRPLADRVHRFVNGSSEARKRVLDLGRHDGMDPAGDETVSLEIPEGLREHLLVDATNSSQQLSVAHRVVFMKRADDERGPAVGDAIEHAL